ncbi:shikimate/quinate hydroxycinnamoyltransferase [Medicago truncatula]|uniref:Shikimate/quinate hydroxycinnamoyltransferase n=1 Tax=Medicago truncatula TaxID=3880 RepID=G7LC37_MEDTR|nr:shikimate/quinate hydroxycinnamoyltransferase [Medicago truncatula]
MLILDMLGVLDSVEPDQKTKMIINVRDSTMVQPLDQEVARRRVWNSNLDLKAPSIHTLGVYFYKTNTTSNFLDAKIMKEALIKVLVLFYPMSDLFFFFSDKDNRVEIDCDSYGVFFVEPCWFQFPTTLMWLRSSSKCIRTSFNHLNHHLMLHKK